MSFLENTEIFKQILKNPPYGRYEQGYVNAIPAERGGESLLLETLSRQGGKIR